MEEEEEEKQCWEPKAKNWVPAGWPGLWVPSGRKLGAREAPGVPDLVGATTGERSGWWPAEIPGATGQIGTPGTGGKFILEKGALGFARTP